MTLRDEILAAGPELTGYRYRLDPPPSLADGTIDCSLFVLKVLDDVGAPLPPGVRTAEQIRQATVPIGWGDVLPGDLLFFEGTYDAAGPAGPDGHIASHIGISLGRGTRKMWDAHDREGRAPDVGITYLSDDYWQPKMLEARRIQALVEHEGTASSPDAQPWGIDVASHQGAVDWQAVRAAGAAFAFTKATGGAWYTNPTLAANWQGMKAAGLKRGAYHFAYESSGSPGGDPEAEAAYFVAAMRSVGGFDPGDMAVLDLEDGNGPLGQWALRWCQRLEQLVGFKPLIYTGEWFSVPHTLWKVSELAQYPLWLAAYQDGMPAPPAPWKSVAFWQHTANGQVAGVAGSVDMNVFNGPSEHLALYGKAGGAAPTDPLDAWRDRVGSGILGLMAEDGTVPLMASTWLPLGRGQADAEAEQCVGANGRQYFWHLASARAFRYDPAA